jgi:GTP-binding protein HflX
VADLLVHVVDSSNSGAAEQIEAVNEVLKEIDAGDKPMLMVFNKTDLISDQNGKLHWLREFEHAVAVSAKKKEGLDELMSELGIMLRPIRSYLQLAIPQGAGQAIARLRAVGQIDEEYYEGDLVHLKARIPPHLRKEFERYVEKDLKETQD